MRMDVFDRMLELARQGFFCAQIMMELALELEGKSDPDLVRAMGGLNGGEKFENESCGAYTGGKCVIAYFAGKGQPDELEHGDYGAMLAELSDWFRDFTGEYGGSTCGCVLGGDQRNRVERCPVMVRETFGKVMEILEAHGAL